jgi:hypothetical protein
MGIIVVRLSESVYRYRDREIKLYRNFWNYGGAEYIFNQNIYPEAGVAEGSSLLVMAVEQARRYLMWCRY